MISQYRVSEQELSNFSKLFEANSVDYIDLDRVDDDLNEDDNNNNNSHNNTNDNDSSLDMSSVMMANSNNQQIDDLEHFDQLLNDDRLKFKVKTVCPIYDLSEDVCFYLKKRRTAALAEQDQQVNLTIESVKSQQKRVLEQLEAEFFRLYIEVNEFADKLNEEEVTRGIPIEAFELDCPNEELKISVLQEFIIIDFKYDEKLNQLNESYSKYRILI